LAEEPKENEKKPEENPEMPKDTGKTVDQEKKSDEEISKEPELKEEQQKQQPDGEITEDKPAEEAQKKQPEEERIKAKPKDVPLKEEQKVKKAKPEKTEEKQTDKTKKKSKHGEDFKYIVRLSNTDIDGEKNLVYGLTGIKGIGMHLANLISEKSGINQHKKIGDLSDSEIEKLQELINSITEHAPNWMLNHRKDLDTGDDIHLVGSEIDMRLRDEINIMKKIRSYRGIRHERSLRVRGQRTKGNNRRGLALGVSKKREK
jgi:small subunit ribosomal protein S13